MQFFKGIGNFFNKTANNDNQLNQSIQNAPSKLTGKMIKDYTLQNKIIQFFDPPTELVAGIKQNKDRVSVYALEKKSLTQQSFIAYQNSLANNYHRIYPAYVQHIQSSNYIYIVLQQLNLPENLSWMAEDFLGKIQQFAMKVKQKISLNGILVNGKKQIIYLPPYQGLKSVSKIYYDGINKTIFAQLFLKVFQLPQKQRKNVYEAIVLYAGTNQLKKQVMKLLSTSQKSLSNQRYQNQTNNKDSIFNQVPMGYNQPKKINQPSQLTTKKSEELYPDLAAEDQEIMKLISVVRINPNLIQGASDFHQMRASSRARHQDDQSTQQIKHVVENANKSMFQINKVVKKSTAKSIYQIKENKKQISENQFQLYFTTYISIFKHFKRTVKSALSFYSKGFSGIIEAYFITLIGILRRSKLVYALNNEYDIFEIGCESVNVEFYTSKIKKQLISEAKILTDLREMILRCYIPIHTFEILSPYLDDHIENINLTKLQDFCFFYMSSLMRNNFQKEVHYINAIQFMYIILHRNFEIVHFEEELPKKWDEEFFELRKQLISSMIPNWSV